MSRKQEGALVLAIYPNARGFAYVLLEGATFPVDWGMSDIQASQRQQVSLHRVSRLLRRYQPDALILRAPGRKARQGRFAQLSRMIRRLAASQGVRVTVISRSQVRKAFGYLSSPARYAIAREIASRIPALAAIVPPARKIWNGEDRRMGLFDAVALALAYVAEADASA